ncbi:hypothetical protein ECG_03377 [Echinococcus granulosus]|uniref:Ovule protein n=1 Tax=Echinococcus granulosus TaxID=6210 RepID=A0A068X238_ECHGR|nr:hypothetical protein ECG_03377 [Echinococcus granulosus]CDS23974.1 hypothetical protein EgrG_002047400 [Echinococcus granulosus]
MEEFWNSPSSPFLSTSTPPILYPSIYLRFSDLPPALSPNNEIQGSPSIRVQLPSPSSSPTATALHRDVQWLHEPPGTMATYFHNTGLAKWLATANPNQQLAYSFSPFFF